MKRQGILRSASWLFLLLVLGGCGPKAEPDAVARFRGGTVSRADIEAFDEAWPETITPVGSLGELLHQSMEQGWLPKDVGTYLFSRYPRLFSTVGEGQYLDAPFHALTDDEVAQERALEKLCLDQLRHEPEQMAGRQLPGLARQIHMFFQALEAGEERFGTLGISQEAMERYYEAHKSDYQVPPSIDLRHLFLNSGLYADRPSRAAAETEALADYLYRRLVEGEPFGRLVRRHSNSDTRNRGGWILEVEPGNLRAEVEQVLQRLEPGEISPPIKTPVGIHIVQLIERHASSNIAFDQVRDEIHSLLLDSRREEHYRRLVSEAAEKWAVQVIPQGLVDGTPSEVVLRVGEETYSLEEIEEDVLALEPEFHRLDLDGQTQIITRLAHAVLYLKGLEEQAVKRCAALELRFKNLVLTEQFLSALAEDRLDQLTGDRREMRTFYSEHRQLYESPWQVRLSLAEIPFPESVPVDPVGNYRRRQEKKEKVEQMIAQLQSEATGPDLSVTEIRSWRTQRTPQPLDQLSQPLREALVPFIANHPQPERLPVLLDQPVEEEENLLVVRVLELVPARQMTFEESLERLQNDYIDLRKPEIIQGLREEILQEADFHFVPTPVP